MAEDDCDTSTACIQPQNEGKASIRWTIIIIIITIAAKPSYIARASTTSNESTRLWRTQSLASRFFLPSVRTNGTYEN